MKIRIGFIAFATLLSFTSCNENKMEIVNTGCKPFTNLYNPDYDRLKNDPISVDTLFIEGDCLNVKVNYGGCTTDHPIELAYIHPMYGAPPFPIPMLEIRHDSRNELCKMLVTNDLSFDLSLLRVAGEEEVMFVVHWNSGGNEISSLEMTYTY